MTTKAKPAAADPILDEASELLAQVAQRDDALEISEQNAATGRFDYLERVVDLDAARQLGLPEWLKQRFGGGRYLVAVRRANGKFGKSRQVTVAGEPKVREPIGAAAAAGAPAATSAWEKVAMVAVGAFATALAPAIVKKMLEGPPPPPDRVDELLKLAAVLKNPNGAGADPVLQMTAMLTMMQKMREFQDELTPAASSDRGGGSGFLSLLTDNVPRVLSMLERGLDREGRVTRRLPATGATAAPATNPTGTGGADSAAVSGTTGTEAPADPLAAMLVRIPTPARAMLHQWAKQDLDPEAYAGVVLDQFDDATYDALVEQLPREDFVDVLLATVPAYQPQRDWFTRLVVAMRAIVSGHADDEALDPQGAGRGNTSSPPTAPAPAATPARSA